MSKNKYKYRAGLYLFLFFIFLSPHFTHATLLKDYFGINLSVNGSGNFNNSWTPVSSTADYIVGDYPATPGAPNPSPFGSTGEAFDAEAIYFDNDNSFAYLAIVTSMPATGYAGSMFGWSSYHFDPGDIAIDLNSNDPAFNYQYGIKTTGPQAGTIKKNAIWVYDNGPAGYPNGYPNQGFAQTPKFNVSTGTSMGNAVSFNYYNANLTERGWATWVIEAKVMLSQLGNTNNDLPVAIRWSPDCNNDLLFLHGDIDAVPPPEPLLIPVPEPSTILLLGVSLIGLCAIKRYSF